MVEEAAIVSNHGHMDGKAMAEYLISKTYKDVYLDILPNESFNTWLINRELPDSFKTTAEYVLVLKSLYENSTGFSLTILDNTSKTHKAMLDVLGKLSSYTIQLLGYTNQQPIKPVNTNRVSPGNIITTSVNYDTLRLLPYVRKLEGNISNVFYPNNNLYLLTVPKESKNVLGIERNIPIIKIDRGSSSIIVKNMTTLNSLVELNVYTHYTSEQLSTAHDIYN
jgi:bifunctional DNA-binding transcriptional regulator/antitoxin component of YhaV-PrlF toxin-antitoxin module